MNQDHIIPIVVRSYFYYNHPFLKNKNSNFTHPTSSDRDKISQDLISKCQLELINDEDDQANYAASYLLKEFPI